MLFNSASSQAVGFTLLLNLPMYVDIYLLASFHARKFGILSPHSRPTVEKDFHPLDPLFIIKSTYIYVSYALG